MSAVDNTAVSVVTMSTMSQQPRTRRQGRTGPVAGGPGTSMLPIKGATPELRKRFKLAAVKAGKPYHAFLDQLLDEHESRERRRLGMMKSPLHRPPENLDDVPDDLDPRDVVGL